MARTTLLCINLKFRADKKEPDSMCLKGGLMQCEGLSSIRRDQGGRVVAYSALSCFIKVKSTLRTVVPEQKSLRKPPEQLAMEVRELREQQVSDDRSG